MPPSRTGETAALSLWGAGGALVEAVRLWSVGYSGR